MVSQSGSSSFGAFLRTVNSPEAAEQGAVSPPVKEAESAAPTASDASGTAQAERGPHHPASFESTFAPPAYAPAPSDEPIEIPTMPPPESSLPGGSEWNTIEAMAKFLPYVVRILQALAASPDHSIPVSALLTAHINLSTLADLVTAIKIMRSAGLVETDGSAGDGSLQLTEAGKEMLTHSAS
jgi:hypothetical protein